jgi:hypothetical protein
MAPSFHGPVCITGNVSLHESRAERVVAWICHGDALLRPALSADYVSDLLHARLQWMGNRNKPAGRWIGNRGATEERGTHEFEQTIGHSTTECRIESVMKRLWNDRPCIIDAMDCIVTSRFTLQMDSPGENGKKKGGNRQCQEKGRKIGNGQSCSHG